MAAVNKEAFVQRQRQSATGPMQLSAAPGPMQLSAAPSPPTQKQPQTQPQPPAAAVAARTLVMAGGCTVSASLAMAPITRIATQKPRGRRSSIGGPEGSLAAAAFGADAGAGDAAGTAAAETSAAMGADRAVSLTARVATGPEGPIGTATAEGTAGAPSATAMDSNGCTMDGNAVALKMLQARTSGVVRVVYGAVGIEHELSAVPRPRLRTSTGFNVCSTSGSGSRHISPGTATICRSRTTTSGGQSARGDSAPRFARVAGILNITAETHVEYSSGGRSETGGDTAASADAAVTARKGSRERAVQDADCHEGVLAQAALNRQDLQQRCVVRPGSIWKHSELVEIEDGRLLYCSGWPAGS
jgi:hypothetical protein